MFLAIALLLAATQTPLEELRQTELDLERVRVLIPATFDRETEEAFFRRVAEYAQVDATITSERVAPTPLELWRVEMSGRGDIFDAAFVVHAVSRRESRLYDLESLQADGETFKARFVLPVFPSDAGTTNFQDRLARSRALLDAAQRVQRSKRLADAAALLDAWPREAPVRLTRADLGESLRLEGASLGAASRAELAAKLKEAGFSITRLEMPPAGACRPFMLTVAYGSMPTQVVDDPTLKSPLCDVESLPAGGRVVARGASGPITLHLRDVELADLFHMLHELSGENFLVDADVKGRVDVELEKATVDEALAAIKGLVITSEPLRRVSLRPRRALTQTYDGEPISMLLSDAATADVFCLLKEITGLDVLVAPQLRNARVTVYAKEVPWDRIFEAMVVSAGAEYKIDKTQVFVGPRANAIAACEVSKTVPLRFTSIPVNLEQLAKSDVEVAGVAMQDGTWKAWLRGPRHRFWLVEPGQKLFDATVKSVSREGVIFE